MIIKIIKNIIIVYFNAKTSCILHIFLVNSGYDCEYGHPIISDFYFFLAKDHYFLHLNSRLSSYDFD